MKAFKGRVAVVTGAASGIGKAVAERCLAEGMQVVIADVDRKALEASFSAGQASGDKSILAVECDVSKREQVEDLAKRTKDAFGAVHLLFNNAGVGAGGSVWDATYHDWEWVIGVNLWGVIHGVKTFIPIMQGQDSECHIVNTASVSGIIPGMGSAPYAVTKHGVVALTENLYSHLGSNSGKIGVSVLCPGPVNSRIYDSERNRPAELMNPGAQSAVVDTLFQALLSEEGDTRSTPEKEKLAKVKAFYETTMSPEEFVDIVFKGIRAKQLYIQNNDDCNPLITNRAGSIVTGTNPKW